jgi:hypothetical protein
MPRRSRSRLPLTKRYEGVQHEPANLLRAPRQARHDAGGHAAAASATLPWVPRAVRASLE